MVRGANGNGNYKMLKDLDGRRNRENQGSEEPGEPGTGQRRQWPLPQHLNLRLHLARAVVAEQGS